MEHEITKEQEAQGNRLDAIGFMNWMEHQNKETQNRIMRNLFASKLRSDNPGIEFSEDEIDERYKDF